MARSGDGYDAHGPLAAWRDHLHRVAGLVGEERPANRRFIGDAAFERRRLKRADHRVGFLFTVLFDSHGRAQLYGIVRAIFNQHGITEKMFEGGDPPFEQSLLLLGVIVGRVFGKVTVLGRGADRRRDLLPPYRTEMGQLSLDLGAPL